MATFDRLFARIKEAVLKALLSDKVRPFIWLYYFPLWCWGVFATFFAGTPSFVLPIYGQLAYDAWAWAHVVATAVVMCGLRMEELNSNLDHSRPPSRRDKISYVGVGWQAGGHASMFGVLLSYELASWTAFLHGANPDPYTMFVIFPYVLGCLLLSLQAGIKLFATEKLKQYLEHGGEVLVWTAL